MKSQATPPIVPATRSAVDVALWFTAQADKAGLRLPAQKLQRLLYLAQAQFSAAHSGRSLMPATFFASALGPVEPNVLVLFEMGQPTVPPGTFQADVASFLEEIWQRLGTVSQDKLLALIEMDGAYAVARSRGMNSEIPLTAMILAYTKPSVEQPSVEVPPGVVAGGVPVPEVASVGSIANGSDGEVIVRKWQPKRRLDPSRVVRLADEESSSGGAGSSDNNDRAIDALAKNLARGTAKESRRNYPTAASAPDHPAQVIKWQPKRTIN